MQSGSRTLGIAFSDHDPTSYVAGAVVRADGVLDGLGFERCTVGGVDATDAVVDLFAGIGREDVSRVLCSGVAPAWFNLIDLRRLHEAVDRPVLSVSYEASPGLEPALRREFDGDELQRRIATYRSLPPRRRVDVDGSETNGSEAADAGTNAPGATGMTAPGAADPLFVRAVGIDDDRAVDVVRQLVRDGFRRPEPVRIAAIAASAHRDAVVE